ncbi:uncharacterized protein PFL1_05268 [Pseudozyma flocculosa PF-1]|uniref:Uncharacterized protein n=2 Tax=Pseudozyma flocculosa TaxID=84751 RepID=A0A5C3F7M5_9BASI|nr:uncharacterized protein PFL1_05268 [Pseudozyma flocculosa PF-1]EPQ27347.1 hypothetical protein PFL1_05268 [Pseudozyma flocculosa PF-1]SPO39725.1 uncharacterized protein PSFLO_05206 [Pseudozyma flocculosa]
MKPLRLLQAVGLLTTASSFVVFDTVAAVDLPLNPEAIRDPERSLASHLPDLRSADPPPDTTAGPGMAAIHAPHPLRQVLPPHVAAAWPGFIAYVPVHAPPPPHIDPAYFVYHGHAPGLVLPQPPGRPAYYYGSYGGAPAHAPAALFPQTAQPGAASSTVVPASAYPGHPGGVSVPEHPADPSSSATQPSREVDGSGSSSAEREWMRAESSPDVALKRPRLIAPAGEPLNNRRSTNYYDPALARRVEERLRAKVRAMMPNFDDAMISINLPVVFGETPSQELQRRSSQVFETAKRRKTYRPGLLNDLDVDGFRVKFIRRKTTPSQPGPRLYDTVAVPLSPGGDLSKTYVGVLTLTDIPRGVRGADFVRLRDMADGFVRAPAPVGPPASSLRQHGGTSVAMAEAEPFRAGSSSGRRRPEGPGVDAARRVGAAIRPGEALPAQVVDTLRARVRQLMPRGAAFDDWLIAIEQPLAGDRKTQIRVSNLLYNIEARQRQPLPAPMGDIALPGYRVTFSYDRKGSQKTDFVRFNVFAVPTAARADEGDLYLGVVRFDASLLSLFNHINHDDHLRAMAWKARVAASSDADNKDGLFYGSSALAGPIRDELLARTRREVPAGTVVPDRLITVHAPWMPQGHVDEGLSRYLRKLFWQHDVPRLPDGILADMVVGERRISFSQDRRSPPAPGVLSFNAVASPVSPGPGKLPTYVGTVKFHAPSSSVIGRLGFAPWSKE